MYFFSIYNPAPPKIHNGCSMHIWKVEYALDHKGSQKFNKVKKNSVRLKTIFSCRSTFELETKIKKIFLMFGNTYTPK